MSEEENHFPVPKFELRSFRGGPAKNLNVRLYHFLNFKYLTHINIILKQVSCPFELTFLSNE